MKCIFLAWKFIDNAALNAIWLIMAKGNEFISFDTINKQEKNDKIKMKIIFFPLIFLVYISVWLGDSMKWVFGVETDDEIVNDHSSVQMKMTENPVAIINSKNSWGKQSTTFAFIIVFFFFGRFSDVIAVTVVTLSAVRFFFTSSFDPISVAVHFLCLFTVDHEMYGDFLHIYWSETFSKVSTARIEHWMNTRTCIGWSVVACFLRTTCSLCVHCFWLFFLLINVTWERIRARLFRND